MENVNKIEIMLIAAPVVVYWFYVLFLLLTELSPHKGIEISMSRKIIVSSIVLVPLALLWGLGVFDAKAVDVEVTLGTFFTPLVDYVMVVWMLCAPIALLYSALLFMKYFVDSLGVPFRKYQIDSTEDCIQAMNAATNFVRDRSFDYEQAQFDRDIEKAQREADEEELRKTQFSVDLTNGLYN